MVTQPRWLRALALGATTLLLTSAAVAVPLAASADTAPADGAPATVSSDALPAPQIDGVAWTQKVVGNTVFVGGRFSTAQPAGAAAGVNTVARGNILAYDLTTGALITGFAPSFNGQVRAIDASPDGSVLYVAGDFNQVDGQSRPFVAALNPSTGAVLSFRAVVNAPVYSLAASGSGIYIGGSFTAVNGVARSRVAQLSADGTAGAFAPSVADGIVRGVVVSPDGGKVVIGGSFSSVNGSTTPGQGLAALDAGTGQLLDWQVTRTVYDHGNNAAVTSLSSDGTNFYGSGYVFGGPADGNLEGTFNASWADGSINWVEDCHGDTYSVAALGDAVYTASHAHYCGSLPNGFQESTPRSYQHGLAFTKATKGVLGAWNGGNPYVNWAGTPAPDLLTWYPDFTVGTVTGQSQAAWNVTTTNKGYVLYAGEFPTVNGTKQAGIVRFATRALAPNLDGPRLSGSKWVPSVVSTSSGRVRVAWGANWDRDNSLLTYSVYRNGASQLVYTTTARSEARWLRPQLGFTDTGLTPGATVSYRIRATDPLGNTVLSSSVSATVSAATVSAYAQKVIADGASSFWRLGEAGGTTAYDWAGYTDLTTGAGVTFGQPGAIVSDSNGSAAFSGDDTGVASTATPVTGPQTFSVEAWFKTTSTAGGKIIGYGSSRTGKSGSYDRHLYLDSSGTVRFGVYPNSVQTLSSDSGLNDGTWHYVVGTLGSTGMQLYVDGKRVSSNSSVTSAQVYDGYWRVGGDNFDGWPGDHSSDDLAGSIDDVAVYPTALSGTTVRSHWQQSGLAPDSAVPTDKYGAAVYAADPDLFWRLGDARGTAAVQDASGNGQTGRVDGDVALGAAGRTGSAGTAATFAGDYGTIASPTRQSTNRYSLETWFKTTTTRGGKLIGFGSSQTGNSGSYDKHVWMLDDGRLSFGVWTGWMNVATTAKSYNDGRWHQVVATQGSDGMRLYVDGVLADTNPQTDGDSYRGSWRIGGDTSWSGSSWYFAGSLQDAAVYGSALTADQVAQHYGLGTGAKVAPTADFAAAVQDRTVAFDASASKDADGTIASYAWDFGDGTTGTGVAPTHTYTKDGAFTATLTVTDDSGLTATAAKTVTVELPNVAPTASFTSRADALSVAFDGSGSKDSDGTVASYAWDFGDGTSGTGATPTHVYAKAGSYTVVLTVTDDRGATASQTAQLSLTAANVSPTAAFSTAVSGATVSFDGSGSSDSDGSIASYAWDFGDGTTGSGKSVQHAYAASGSYTVKLTVTDDRAGTGSASRAVAVTVPATTQTQLAQDAFGRTVGSGLGTADVGGAWTIASGASSFSVTGGAGSVSTKAGSTLTALLGSVSSTSSDVAVTVALPVMPVGSNSYFDLIGRRVGTADYNGRLIVAPNGVATLYVQQGSTVLKSVKVPGLTVTAGMQLRMRLQVSGTSPTTVQAKVWQVSGNEPAAWTVSATDSTAALQTAGSIGLRTYLGGSTTNGPITTVIDDFAATGPGTAPAPNVAPTASFTSRADALSVVFDGSGSKDSDGSVASYAWDFGDGTSGTGVSPTHVYAKAGSYSVVLTVTDDRGATASQTASLSVLAANVAPTASFTSAVSAATASFDGSASSDPDGSIASYAWDFGDGTTGTGKSVQHVYAASGSYTVKLTVTDDRAGTGSITRTVPVTVPSASQLALDGFDRTVTSGFGTADVGGAWTIASGASSFSVTGGAGSVSTKAGSTLTALLGSVSSTSADVAATVALPVMPVGSSSYFDLIGRRVGTADYNARIVVAPDGTVSVYVQQGSTVLKSARVSGLTYTAGTKLRVRLQVSGTSPTTVQAKVWQVSGTEPASWTVSATDTTAALQAAGSVGLRTYQGGSTSNGPIITAIDDYSATGIG